MSSLDYHREHFVPEEPPSRVGTIVLGVMLGIVTFSTIGLIGVATNPDFAQWVYNNKIWQTLSAGYQTFWCWLGRC